jgi:hypothetical protein
LGEVSGFEGQSESQVPPYTPGSVSLVLSLSRPLSLSFLHLSLRVQHQNIPAVELKRGGVARLWLTAILMPLAVAVFIVQKILEIAIKVGYCRLKPVVTRVESI